MSHKRIPAKSFFICDRCRGEAECGIDTSDWLELTVRHRLDSQDYKSFQFCGHCRAQVVKEMNEVILDRRVKEPKA